MWIKLTRNDLEPVLINVDELSHIGSRNGGGSTVYFAEGVDKKDNTKQKVIAVRETVAEIHNLLMATASSGIAASKARTAK